MYKVRFKLLTACLVKLPLKMLSLIISNYSTSSASQVHVNISFRTEIAGCLRASAEDHVVRGGKLV